METKLSVEEIPVEDMYAAFRDRRSTGDYKKDEMLFEEFQRGWLAAIEWVNSKAVKLYEAN